LMPFHSLMRFMNHPFFRGLCMDMNAAENESLYACTYIFT
jgi:hypothetical protein